MKNFWKENSYNIVKMFIFQIGMTIFGLIVSAATLMLSKKLELADGSRWPLLAGSIFASVFYLFLLFYMTSEIGRSDGVRIEAGRQKYQRFKGLYMSLMANSINILLGIMAVVGKLFVTNIGFFERNVEVDAIPAWAAGLSSIGEVISKLLNGMYMGIQLEYFSGNPLFCLFLSVPAIAVCTLAYIYGVRRLMKHNPKDDEKRQRYALKKEKDDIYYQQ